MVGPHAAVSNRNCSGLRYRDVEIKIRVVMIVLKKVHRSSEL